MPLFQNMPKIQELNDMGQRCLNLGNPKEALEFFDKVLSLDKKNIMALIKKGNILGKLGKYQEAILFYDLVLEQESGNVLALVNKGLSFHYLEMYDEAIRCYDKVLEIKPDSATALYNKSSSLIRQNNIAQGLEILKNVIKKDFSFRAKAKYDIDFQEIKHLTEFKKIIL